MPVDGIDNGAEIHIGNGKRGILFKAGGEHEQQITELINVLDVCRRKVLPDTVCFGEQQQMLILLIDLLRVAIGVGVIEMLRRCKGNDIFQVETDFRIKRFWENMVHVRCMILKMSGFRMLSLPIAVLVVEDPEKTSCLVGLIAVIGFVDDNRMRCSVFLAGNTFGLVRVDIPEVGTVIHQHIISDDLLGKMAAYGAVSIVSIRKRMRTLVKIRPHSRGLLILVYWIVKAKNAFRTASKDSLEGD